MQNIINKMGIGYLHKDLDQHNVKFARLALELCASLCVNESLC